LLAERLEDRRVLALFAPVATYSSGGLSDYNLAVADFNSDGHMDIVAADIDTGRGVGVLTNDGLGAFSTIILNTGSTPGYNVATGDFDGDNRPDIAVTSFSDVKVFLNTSPIGTATPTFAGAVSTPASAYPIAAGELDGDGRLDLIVATNGTGPGIHFLKGQGNGQFVDQGALPSSAGFPFHDLASRDVNSDGKLDAIGATMFSNGVYVALGDGLGGFTFKGHYLAGGGGSRHVALGDLNGDSRLDVVTANQDDNTISVLLGDGSGAFALSGTQPHTFSSGGSGPSSVGIADFNLDGWADVVVSNRNTDIVGVLLGNGAGVLDPVVTFFSGGFSAKDIVSGDFNNDSLPDVAVANTSSSNVGILLNTSFRGFFTPVAPDPRTEPVSSVDFTFTTDILPGDFDYNDLSLTFNGGGNLIAPSVTVTSLGGNAYRIGNLAGLTAGDGKYLLTVVGSGIRDSNSNPLIGNATELWTTDHKLPALNSVAPLGSLIYDPVETRSLPTVTDVQNLQIDLDPGQKFSVRIQPTSALRLNVTVLNPANVAIDSFTASATGDLVLFQNLNAATAGTYTISVGTAGGTTGDFTLQVFLNTDMELENNGGPTNNSLPTAQNIDGSFIDLTAGAAQRGAVVGHVSAPQLLVGSDQNGRFLRVDPVTGAATVIAASVNGGRGYTDLARNPITGTMYGSGARGDAGLYVVDPVTGAGTFVGASGNGMHSLVWSPDGTTLYGVDQGQFGTINTATGVFSIIASAPDFVHGMAYHPGTGILYALVGRGTESLYTLNPATGTFTFVGSTGQRLLSLEFLPDGTLLAGGDSSLFSLNPSTGAATLIGVTSGGTLLAGLESIPTIDSVDLYAFTLVANQTTTVAVDGAGSKVELLDSDGTVLASGMSAVNVSQVISNFAAPVADVYYARVTHGFIGGYSLLVTRDAAFDTESNSEDSPQPLGNVNTVLGHVRQGSPFGTLSPVLYAVAGVQGAPSILYELDPSNGQITQVIGPIGFSNVKSLDFDPISGSLYGHSDEGGLLSIDPVSGIGTSIGNDGVDYTNISFDSNGVVYGSSITHANPGIWTIDVSTGVGTQLFNFGDRHRYAVSVDANDQLWLRDDNSLYKINPPSVNFVANITGFTGGSFFRAGEFHPDNGLYYDVTLANGSIGPATLHAINPETGVATPLGTAPIGISALTFGGGNTGDFYTFNVIAGQPISWTSFTPAGGPFEFENNLDPYLELFDPSGTRVAFNDNGALDGRNAVLTHTALATGTYTLRIFGTNSTQGEYILTANQPPTVNNQTFNVDENSNNGTVVGTVTASDPDAGQTLTFGITGGNAGGVFALNPVSATTAELVVANNAALDFETNPVFSLTLQVTDPNGASDTATVTVNLNDLSTTLSISDASIIEGNGGTSVMTFNVSTGASAINEDFTINFATENGTAGDGSGGTDNDYVATSGTLSFNGTGSETRPINITVNGDTKVEQHDAFSVLLSALTGTNDLSVTDATAIGRINNDDTATLTLAIPSITETDVDQTVNATVTLSADVEDGFDVAFGTALLTAEGTDITFVTGSPLTFAGTAGEVENIQLTIEGDDIVEDIETFTITLGAVSDASAEQIASIVTTGSPATGTVDNDDTATLTLAIPLITESNLDQTVNATVTLSADVEDGFQAAFGTALLTAEGTDITFVTGSPLTFAGTAGEVENIQLTIEGDTIVEDNETFTITLGGVSNTSAEQIASIGTSGTPATGTIDNDDTATLTLAIPSITETDVDQTVNATVTLSADVEDGFHVAFGTALLTAEGTDITFVTGSPLTFAGTAGEVENIQLTIEGDDIVEDNETFTITLGAVSDASAEQIASIVTAGSPATGTIDNDDTARLMISDVSLLEGDAPGTTAFTFTVNIDPSGTATTSEKDITVMANTSGITASGGGVDFADIANHTLTIAAGTTSTTVTVHVTKEDLAETDETLQVNLTDAKFNGTADPSRVVIGDAIGIGTIVNDDFAPVADAGGPYVINEGDGLALDGSGSTDTDSQATLTYTWDVDGDGDYDENVTGKMPTLTSAQMAALGLNDGPDSRTVTVLVSDGTNTSTATASLTINNVAPEILMLSATSVAENGIVTLTGTYLDDGTQDTHTIDIDWGPGETQSLGVVVSGGTFTVTHQYLDDNPSGTASDVYTIGVTLKDDDTGSDEASTTTTITNVDPVIDGLSATSVNEDGTVTLTGTYHDTGTQDTYTIDIDWGPGETPSLGVVVTGGTFTVTHQYLDDNPTGTPSDNYTISVTLTDDDTGSDDASTTTTITNVDPVIEGISNTSPDCGMVAEGESVGVSGTFTDVGTLDIHTGTIDWGDGSTSPATIIESGGSGSFAGSHVYTDGGIYTVTVTLTDDDTGVDTAITTTVIVGVGIVDDVLYVIGTENDDHVMINQQGNGTLKVHADFLPTGNFKTFNLAAIDSIMADLCHGDDHLTIAGNVALPAILKGGEGNDHLNAGGGPTILLGGAGDDQLNAGGARSLLIGGTGKDKLNGGNQDDILIGGSSTQDGSDTNLLAALAAWSTNGTYSARVTAVLGLLNDIEDGAKDDLNGTSGRDLYFSGVGDDLKAKLSGNDAESVV
jgi:hypothetical protein